MGDPTFGGGEWQGWSLSDQMAHPWSPAAGNGPGRARTPGPMGAGPDSALPAPNSAEGRNHDPGSAAAQHAAHKTDSVIDQILHSSSLEHLKSVAEVILGPYSFGLGACVGVVKNPVNAVLGVVDLAKTLVLADLYQRVNHDISWKSFIPSFAGPGVMGEMGMRALIATGLVHIETLKAAYDKREGMIKEIGHIMAHPLDFLESIPGKIAAEYKAKWARFTELFGKADLQSEFEAGEIFGDLLMEIVMTILTLISVAGAAAKLAAKVPQLLRLAGVIREVESAALVEETAAASEGAAAGARAAPKVEAKPNVETKPTAKNPTPERTPQNPPEAPAKEPPASRYKKPVPSELPKTNAYGNQVRIREGSNGKVAVMGRSMNKLVEPYAAELSKQGYDVEIFKDDVIPDAAKNNWKEITKNGHRLTDEEAVDSEMFKANQEWANKLVKQDYTVVDVGAPPDASMSPFYEMEKETVFAGAQE